MITRNQLILFSIIGFFIGGIFLAFQHSVLIFRNPFVKNTIENKQEIERRKVKLFYWLHDKWNSEEVDIIWSSSKSQTVKYLIDSWLSLIDEEQLMEKKTSLQSAVLGASESDIFLSFDRNPFSKESNVFEKWMWVEGLLKTLRESDLKVQNIRFLVHHQDMYDIHLDFSHPWPSIGFLAK
jgi:hypothetical protein